MTDCTPRPPLQRPLVWDDFVIDLQDTLLELNPPPAYIVGGAVRDAYLHRPIKDVDIVTPHGQAIPLARRITDALQADIYIMDKERDVARVFIQTPEGLKIMDVAGFRGATLADDLHDRDFTINAMACDLHGDITQIIDPLNGQKDALDKVLRQCHQASLTQDAIRVMRAIRQSAQFTMRIEPATLASMRQAVPGLAHVSPERVRDELFNMLVLTRPVAALRVAHKLGIFEIITPVFDAHMDAQRWQHALTITEKLHAILTGISPKRTDNTLAVFDLGMLIMQFDRYRVPLRQHIMQTTANERPYWAVLLLGALVSRVPPEALPTLAHDLRLSSAEAQAIQAMNLPQSSISRYVDAHTLSDLDIHRFWYPARASGIDAILLYLATYLADAGTQLHQQTWLRLVDNAHQLLHAYFNDYQRLVEPTPILDGHTLMQAFSLSGGRIIGELLTFIREAQVTGEVTTRDEALSLVRHYLQN